MSEWTNNNVAHRQTWYVLRVMNQNQKGFKESRDVRMDELTYWAGSASDALRQQQADTLAMQMDNIFRMILKASLEDGIQQAQAVQDIANALLTADGTIQELATTNDANYAFLGEADA